jgi:HEAT repeat protein
MARLVIFVSAMLLCAIAFCANVTADEKDDQRVQKLIRALQSKDAFERRDAAKQLGEETAHIDVLPHLEKVLTEDSNYDVAQAAAFAISGFGKQGDNVLLRAADHKEPSVRQVAIMALQFSKTIDSDGFKKAAAHLVDPDADVRIVVLNTFARLRYSEAAENMLKMAKDDENEGVRLAAIAAVGNLSAKAKMVAPNLIDLLRDPKLKWEEQRAFRKETGYALGHLRKDAMPFVLSTLTDPKSKPQTKVTMLWAIAASGQVREKPELISVIATYVEDKDFEVRLAALLATGSFDRERLKPYEGKIGRTIRLQTDKADLYDALTAMAIFNRDGDLWEDVVANLKTGISPYGKSILRLIELGVMTANDPKVLKAVKLIAESDPDKDMRMLAGHAYERATLKK